MQIMFNFKTVTGIKGSGSLIFLKKSFFCFLFISIWAHVKYVMNIHYYKYSVCFLLSILSYLINPRRSLIYYIDPLYLIYLVTRWIFLKISEKVPKQIAKTRYSLSLVRTKYRNKTQTGCLVWLTISSNDGKISGRNFFLDFLPK